MRRLALTSATVVALLTATLSASGQQQRQDGGGGTVKGQSERPTSPKQAEPESSSHNADKPKASDALPGSPGNEPKAAPVERLPDQKKK
jgi:hypothetical protein